MNSFFSDVFTIVVVILFLTSFGCTRQFCPNNQLMNDCKYIESPAQALDRLFQNNKSVTFRSRAGNLYRMDSDTEITLFSNRNVKMAEYGFGLMYYYGMYIILDDGTIELNLNKYHGVWPKMVMVVCTNDVFLFTQSGKTGLEFGGRGGAVESSKMKPFWPFKMVVPESTEHP